MDQYEQEELQSELEELRAEVARLQAERDAASEKPEITPAVEGEQDPSVERRAGKPSHSGGAIMNTLGSKSNRTPNSERRQA
jgi:hypothetical protein